MSPISKPSVSWSNCSQARPQSSHCNRREIMLLAEKAQKKENSPRMSTSSSTTLSLDAVLVHQIMTPRTVVHSINGDDTVGSPRPSAGGNIPFAQFRSTVMSVTTSLESSVAVNCWAPKLKAKAICVSTNSPPPSSYPTTRRQTAHYKPSSKNISSSPSVDEFNTLPVSSPWRTLLSTLLVRKSSKTMTLRSICANSLAAADSQSDSAIAKEQGLTFRRFTLERMSLSNRCSWITRL